MGLAWEFAALTGIANFRGLTISLVPLHSSGIAACVGHIFYNHIHVLVPIQALLTCFGNSAAAYAAWRIANHHQTTTTAAAVVATAATAAAAGAAVAAATTTSTWITAKEEDLVAGSSQQSKQRSAVSEMVKADDAVSTSSLSKTSLTASSSSSLSTTSTTTLVGFEDLGEALRQDSDAYFLAKLFLGTALASYLVKYGGVLLWSLWQQREMNPNDDATAAELALVCIIVPSLLNAYKWYQLGLLSQEAE
jgi:Protein of unknown function (DUF2499)